MNRAERAQEERQRRLDLGEHPGDRGEYGYRRPWDEGQDAGQGETLGDVLRGLGFTITGSNE